jgi:outer membrane protein OmpA-like peptidoglycan-associated protein
MGASVAIGKWFTPGLGLRTKLTGIWGRQILSQDKETNAMKYWTLNEQVLFNLSNMFCGYSDTRVWNFIPYLGGGISRNMTQNTYSMGLNFGILNTWRLSKRVMINLDLSLGAHDEDFGAGIATDGNIKRWKLENYDRELNAEVGLTFNLGKATFNKVPDVDAIKALSESQIAALNAQLADANAENARLNNLIKNHKCPEAGKTVTVKEVAAAPVSVFFNLGSAKIASKKDIVNVQALADLAKANDKTIVVTGYADSKTGSANFNQTLSEKRANAVKAELVKMGVAESKIEVKAAGGVNDINPFAYNRRAVVEVK